MVSNISHIHPLLVDSLNLMPGSTFKYKDCSQMWQQARRKLVSFILCSVIAITPHSANAQNNSDTYDKNKPLDILLDEKIEYYRQQYPEISFLVLQGGEDLIADVMALDLILGHQPSSLDYEHPQKLREDLMIASANRILLMLQHGMPSASLFKVNNPLDWQAHICVLTINPTEVSADSIRATQNLLDLPREFVEKIPQDFRLQPADYLEFVIDHEVYHCLYSMYVGPQKMSYKTFWAEYNSFLNEQGADAFALGMHINSRHEVPSFAENIMRIRGVALMSGDPDHLTCKALQQIVNIPPKDLAEMSVNEIFDNANRIQKRLTISYDEYIQYLAASVQAMKELGVEALIAEDLRNRIKDTKADPSQVRELVTNTRRFLSELSCEEG